MKILPAILIITLFISCTQEPGKRIRTEDHRPVSKDTSAVTESAPQTTDEIKREFTVLNDKLLARQLDSAGFKYNCDEVEGEVYLYYENKKLKMVKHFFADSHFSSLTKYFVKSDQVFFIFKDDTLWQFDGGTPEKPITKDSINQQRIYLKDENPIQCLEKNYTIRSVGKNADPEKIPNRDVKCDVKELMSRYHHLLKNKDQKSIECL